MRTKDELFAIEDITTLLQYLYMDEKHVVTFNNGLTDLRIRMNEDYEVFCSNLSFPDLPETHWDNEMSPASCMGIIEWLKTAPAEEHKGSFKSRWDEIKMIVSANLVLNRPKSKRIPQED